MYLNLDISRAIYIQCIASMAVNIFFNETREMCAGLASFSTCHSLQLQPCRQIHVNERDLHGTCMIWSLGWGWTTHLSMDKHLLQHWRCYPQDTIRNLIGSMRTRCTACLQSCGGQTCNLIGCDMIILGSLLWLSDVFKFMLLKLFAVTGDASVQRTFLLLQRSRQLVIDCH